MDCDFQFLAPVGEVYPAFGEALHFHQAGQRAAARAGYLALMDDPALMAVCTHQLAWLAIAEGDFARAAELLPLAIRLHPELPQFYRSLSDLARRVGDTATANRAVKDMACLLFRLGDEINGRAVAQEALALLPGDCGMLGQLAMSFVRQGERPAALAHFMAVIRLFGRIEPRLADLVATLERRLADLDWVPLPLSAASPETVQGLEEAVSALGHLLREIGCFPEALACYRLLVEIYPELPITHFNLALALLTAGDFIEGWREYQWHWRSGQADLRYLSLPIPSWQGEPLDGCRILVWAEQGYGDVIQFGPLAQSLVRPGVQVVLGVHKPLLRLFKNSFPDLELIERPESPEQLASLGRFDFKIASMALPVPLGLKLADLPLALDYLRPLPADRDRWALRLPRRPGRCRIGLVWAGNVEYPDDKKRSVPFDLLQPLFALPGIDWHTLQIGPTRNQRIHAKGSVLKDLAPRLHDFADTAAAIANLDLVISVDTAVAHLAGAMGQPVWLLARRPSEWRWGDQGDGCPWYPSLRQFRQSEAGDWSGVIERVRNCLIAEGWSLDRTQGVTAELDLLAPGVLPHKPDWNYGTASLNCGNERI